MNMDLEKLSILVVDDMRFSRESIRIALEKSGVKTIWTAENALAGLLCIQRHNPDVVLVDKMMPRIDGLKLIEKIREHDQQQQRHTMVILLTADESEQSLRGAIISGADHYLYKDANSEKILNCIEYIQTQHRAQQILKELESQERHNREQSPKLQLDKNQTAAQNAAYQGETPSSLNYLIVDDELFAAESLRSILAKIGMNNVRIARNALDALKLHKKLRADIIFVDYQMPKVDGTRLTKMIRKDESDDRRTPIIMVTAAASIKKIEEAILAGVDEYLYKPPNPNDLVLKIEAAYKKHNPEKALSGIEWSYFF